MLLEMSLRELEVVGVDDKAKRGAAAEAGAAGSWRIP